SGTKTLTPPAASNDFGIECSGPDGQATANASVSVVLPHYTVARLNFSGVNALNDLGGVAGWTGGGPPSPAGPQPPVKAAWSSGPRSASCTAPTGSGPAGKLPAGPLHGGIDVPESCERHQLRGRGRRQRRRRPTGSGRHSLRPGRCDYCSGPNIGDSHQ